MHMRSKMSWRRRAVSGLVLSSLYSVSCGFSGGHAPGVARSLVVAPSRQSVRACRHGKVALWMFKDEDDSSDLSSSSPDISQDTSQDTSSQSSRSKSKKSKEDSVSKAKVKSSKNPVMKVLVQWYDKLLAMLPPALTKRLLQFVNKLMDVLPTMRTIGVSFVAGAIVAVAAVVVPVFTNVDKLTEPVTLFETILTDLDRGYVENVDTQKLFETGVSAMLRSLDPYTEFEGRKEAIEMQESVSGKYGGVGLVISGRERTIPSKPKSVQVIPVTNQNQDQTMQDDELSPMDTNNQDTEGLGKQASRKLRKRQSSSPTTTTPKKNIPQTDGIRVVSAFEGYAFDAGMRVGDRIVAVDDYTVQDETTVEEVRNHLRGDPGTTVSVSFYRDGVDGMQTVQIPRRIVKIHDVKAATLLGRAEEGLGYIQLSGFSQDAGNEMRGAIAALQKRAEQASDGVHGLQGLVIDLRQNPGGLLTSAVDVASILVPKNSDIVSARGRGFPSVVYRSRVDPMVDTSQTKLVLLVSSNTASAAEIVSGAVQDLDVGVILGADRTFGKGLVQNVEELPFDTALKFTVAKYYTPSGRCIQSTNYEEGGGLLNAAANTNTNSNSNSNAESATFKATEVQEADRSEFYTTRGRIVKDGGGIEADVKVATPKASALEVSLLRANLLNEYAAEWSKRFDMSHGFQVTDALYEDFQSFVLSKQSNHEIDLLDSIYAGPIESLKKALQQSGYKHSLNKELTSLQASIRHEMKNDFDTYKHDIKEDLGQAILARYLPESMLIARGARDDVQVQAAMKLMRDQNKFNQILARADVDGGRGINSDRTMKQRQLARQKVGDGQQNGGLSSSADATGGMVGTLGSIVRDETPDLKVQVKW